MIANIAMRLGMLSVTSVNRCNTIILDEFATAFDEKRMEDFHKVLGIIKEKFDFVILITHLDYMKDMVDKIIEVEVNANGDAKIKQ